MADKADSTRDTEWPDPEKSLQDKMGATSDSMKVSGQLAFEAAKEKLGHAVDGLKELQWDKVPEAVAEHVKNNPKMSAFQLVCLLVTVVPRLVATPALLDLGFGSSGPVGGWLAATFQSIYGTPLVFRALQSAAMGGWGAAAVNGVIQGGALAFAGITSWFKPKDREQKQEDKDT